MQLTHKASLALVFLPLCGLAATLPASAQINGFGNGSGFTLNTNGSGSPSISGGTFEVTTSDRYEAASAYYDAKQNITSFTSDFTYEDVTGGGDGGFTFVLQNAGLNALGSGLGTTGVTPSAALDFDVFFFSGVQFTTDGAQPYNFISTGSVGLPTSSPVNVHVSYDGATLTEDLTQDGYSFSQSYAVDLSSVLGSDTAYVGFTGASGGGGYFNTQNISDFQFTPAPIPEASTTVSFGLLLCLGLGGLGWSARRRKARSAV